MKRILLAGMTALATVLAACAHAPAVREAESPGMVQVELPPVRPDSMSEAVVRAFLLAEIEDRLADERADALVAAGEVEKEKSTNEIDQADFDLPITVNERVQYWMEYFQTRGRERFAAYLSRMGRYEEMIRSELRAREMPEDLIYLAMIESGFSPAATSRAKAVGVWQFMAPTARIFKLEVSRYVDERRDPVRSTQAALSYLQALYDRFGSWYLAAAGYNSGENRIERLLRRHHDGARGDDELFWKISKHLPSETRNYVPKLIAAAILSKYRDRYGFGDVIPEESIAYDVVTVPDATDLGVIARAAGVKVSVIEALNPHFLRGVTPPQREVEVRVPAGRGEEFRVAYAKIPPSERVTRIEHVVRRGETLSGIAKRYRTTVAAIQETNRIRNANSIRAGMTLVIDYAAAKGSTRAAEPKRVARTTSSSNAGSGSAAGNSGKTPAGSGTIYKVRAGDSLWSIAREHGITVEELRSWNNLRGSRIVPGQELKIGAQRVIRYTIQPGDTVWAIAQRHGISADRLLQWNKLSAGAVIRPGEELEVPITQ